VGNGGGKEGQVGVGELGIGGERCSGVERDKVVKGGQVEERRRRVEKGGAERDEVALGGEKRRKLGKGEESRGRG
jgi:hypothetical protein